MSLEEFKNNLKKMNMCFTVYYPQKRQFVLCMNINGRDAIFVYDEERINELSWEEFMCVLDDDMFLFANRRVDNES